jgi:hypothetical protein
MSLHHAQIYGQNGNTFCWIGRLSLSDKYTLAWVNCERLPVNYVYDCELQYFIHF